MIARPAQTDTSRERPSTRRRLAVALAACAVPLLLVSTATTASAGRAIVEHWVDEYTVTYPDGSEDFCGDLGFDVVEHGELKGVFVGTPRGREGLWYFGDRFSGSFTWSNPETGGEFTQVFAGSDRDQAITDNGDGTLTIQVQLTGPSRYYVDGDLTFIDTGMVRFSILIDHAGTPTDPDDDEFIEFLGIDKEAGLRQTEGRDFCADIAEFLG